MSGAVQQQRRRFARAVEAMRAGALPWMSMNSLGVAVWRERRRDPQAYAWLTREGPRGRGNALWVDLAAGAADLEQRARREGAARLRTCAQRLRDLMLEEGARL